MLSVVLGIALKALVISVRECSVLEIAEQFGSVVLCTVL
jgi:hypothetical protein